MKAFVTGATGFVGGHLVETLAARGDTVLALARRPETHADLTARGATPVPGSLDHLDTLGPALAGVDVVYHLAGLTAARDEAEFLAVNEGGTRGLIETLARVAPAARFVYVSSQAALGPSPRGTPLGEDAACRPVTAYGRSKLAGEQATRAGALAWTIVRPSAVYGPRDREFLRLFEIVRWGVAPVFGDGTQELSMVFAPELAGAIAEAGTRPGAAGEVIHLAHREVVHSREVALAAGLALGRSPFVLPVPGVVAAPIVSLIGRAAAAAGRRTVVNAEKMAEFLAPSWLLDTGKAERVLGWTATVALDEGMRRTAAWYREHGWLR